MSAFWSDAKRQFTGAEPLPLWTTALLFGGPFGAIAGVFVMQALGGNELGGGLSGALLTYTLYIFSTNAARSKPAPPPRLLPARRWLCGVKDCAVSVDTPPGDTRLPPLWLYVQRVAASTLVRVHLLDGTILDVHDTFVICPLHAMPECDPSRPVFIELDVGREPTR